MRPHCVPGGIVEDTQRGYFPAIDGLRALAVGAVLLFHGRHLGGGFLGVDSFFVISGFLITGLMLREVDTSGTVKLGAFWARRARRLLPALALMVIAVTLWSARFGTPSERLALHGDTLWSLSFLMNWHEVTAAHDYWSSFALQSPLTHLWSLAVEEQFYLVWPLVALVVVRWARRPQRSMVIVLSVGAIASFALMAALYEPTASTRVYEGTDTRIGAMMIGGLFATSAVRSFAKRALGAPSRLMKIAVSATVVVATLAALCMYAFSHGNDPWLFRGGFFLFALSIGIIIAAVTAGSAATAGTHAHPAVAVAIIAGVLSLRPLRSIGRLSYGLYLWHWPIFLALSPVRTGLSEWPLLAARLGVTWVVAVVSYRLVEQPVRLGLQHRPQWLSAPVTAAAVGVAALLGVTVSLPSSAATAVNVEGIAALAAIPSHAPLNAPPSSASLQGSRIETNAGASPDGARDSASVRVAAAHPITVRGSVDTVIMFGDSIAYTTAPGIQAAFEAAGVTFMSAAGPGLGLVKFTNHLEYLRSIAPIIDSHPFLILVQLSVWDAPYGEQTQYQALTLLHQYIADHHGQMAIVSPPPLRPDQDKGGYDALLAAAQHVARDSPNDVVVLDSSEVWGHKYNPDLNGDHVPERMYDGVHICPSGAALVGAWLVASLAPYFNGITPAPVASWAGGAWTNHPIYSSPPGTCAAV